MVAPALPQIADEFNLAPGSVLESMTLSVFVLAYAIGPLIFVSLIINLSSLISGPNILITGTLK
jgi:hypothetical protein